jgi:hypothetical protein
VRLRNPLIALSILVALGAYVFLVEIRGGARRQKEKEESERVLAFDPAKATGLTLTRPGERIRLEKDSEGWRIREPVPAGPDPEAVDRLLRELAGLKKTKELGVQSDLAPFTLQPPRMTVEVTAASSRPLPILHLGENPPTGTGTYASLGEDRAVRLVSGADSVRDATLFSLRDKTLFKFDPERLTGLRLVRRGEEEKAGGRGGAKSKESALVLTRADGDWRLSEPLTAPVAPDGVSDLLYALQRLSVTQFVDEKPSVNLLAERGLDPARYRVVARGGEWAGDRELRFGNAESGSLYAVHPASGALVKISDSIEIKLKGGPADFRRKELVGFSRFDIRRIRLEGLGPVPLELEKKDDQTWIRRSAPPGELAAEKLDPLLASLADLKAESFIDEPRIDPGRFGLQMPSATLRIEKTGDEKHPLVARVGRDDGKGRIAMKDDAWPSVLVVPGDLWKKVVEEAGKVIRETPVAPPTAPAAAGTGGKPGS